MRAAWLLTCGAVLATPLAAQAFPPPPVQRTRHGGTQVGLFGFGLWSGLDVKESGQVVLGAALDIGNVAISRLRLRPSAEIAILNGANTYTGNFEVLYRFADDKPATVPYAGGGIALAGHAGCGTGSGCPAAWVNAVVGIEVRYRSTFSWMLEYRALDAFQHNRFCVGLTTRRGS